jgi:hypothetical protein
MQLRIRTAGTVPNSTLNTRVSARSCPVCEVNKLEKNRIWAFHIRIFTMKMEAAYSPETMD